MTYTVLGKYDRDKAGHEEYYFSERHTFIDYRGNLKISPLSYWGFGIMVITASHDISKGEFSPMMIFKSVIVDDYAWIASGSILYNCHIMHHGIVGIGSVVKNMTVKPYTIVSGNPARVVARWNGEKWEKKGEIL